MTDIFNQPPSGFRRGPKPGVLIPRSTAGDIRVKELRQLNQDLAARIEAMEARLDELKAPVITERSQKSAE